MQTEPPVADPPMRKSRWLQFSLRPPSSLNLHRLILLMPLTIVAADAVAFRSLNRDPPSANGGHIWLAALVHSQIGLLWIWASLGRTHAVVRWTAAIGGTIALAGLASWAYHDLDEMRAIAVGFFGFTAGGIAMILAGVPLEIAGSSLRPGRLDSMAGNRLQFSLRNLFEAVTAIALLAFVTKLILLPINVNSNVAREILREAPLALLFSAVALLAMWGVLGWQFRPVPWALLAVAVWLPKFWPTHIPCAAPPSTNASVVALTSAIDVACLAFCRLCGIRLIWCEGLKLRRPSLPLDPSARGGG